MTKSRIKKSLLKQLKARGAEVDYYVDLVESYLKFWDIEEKLTTDIATHGIKYKDKSSVGVDILKNNPSIKEVVSVNRQRLQILRELGLTVDNVGADDDDPL